MFSRIFFKLFVKIFHFLRPIKKILFSRLYFLEFPSRRPPCVHNLAKKEKKNPTLPSYSRSVRDRSVGCGSHVKFWLHMFPSQQQNRFGFFLSSLFSTHCVLS